MKLSELLNKYHITYQNDIQRSYMAIKLLPHDKQINYQLRMLQENPSKQLLNVHKKQIDQEIYFCYDITSKITLSQLLKRKRLNKHEFLSILKSLLTGLKLESLYLLKSGIFLLDDEHIYVNPSTFEISLAFLPIESDFDKNEAVKELLTDLLVYKVSFITPDQGGFTIELLGLLKNDDFCVSKLEDIINNLAVKQEPASIQIAAVDKKQKVNMPNSIINRNKKEDKKDNKFLIFIPIQIFLIAITALLIRYLLSKQQNIDISSIIGLVIIVGAVDLLIIKRLKPITRDKLSNRTSSEKHKAEKDKVAKNKNKLKKQKSLRGFIDTDNKGLSVDSIIEPTEDIELETRMLFKSVSDYPFLISISEGVDERISIDKPSFIIGRIKYQADYISKNNAIGKLHAEIISRDGYYYIKDFNSRNGTYINGERIASNVECAIQLNDRISFANSEYKFIHGEGPNKSIQYK